MANMIPNHTNQQLDQMVLGNGLNKFEAQVYKHLRNLPEDYTVRFNYLYLANGYDPSPGGGQIDFIILVPGKGFLVLEVKGSKAFRSQQGHHEVLNNGIWVKTDDPWEQSVRNMHRIKTEVKACLGEVPCLFGNAVAFPNLRPDLIPKNFHSVHSYFTQEDLGSSARLKEKIDSHLNPEHLHIYRSPMTKSEFDHIAEILTRNVIFVFCDNSHTGEELETQGRLTEEQIAYMRDSENYPRLIVRGAAGSGKTILALNTTRKAAESGMAAYICHNKLLAAWLRVNNRLSINPELSFQVYHFDAFVKAICKNQNVQFQVHSNGDYDPFKVLESMEQALAFGKARNIFDSIVVDEAQDFIPNLFPLLEQILKPDGKIHFFFDADQNIYQEGKQLFPDGDNRLMPFNCRNTRSVVDYAWRVLGKPNLNGDRFPLPHAGLLDGEVPIIRQSVEKGTDHLNLVKGIVDIWLNEGVDPSQIAVLSPLRNGSCLGQLQCATHGMEFVTDKNQGGNLDGLVKTWIDGNAVLRTTIKSFKGMEASHVILAELPEVGTLGFGIGDLYVGVTRARSRLVLLPTSEKAKSQLTGYLESP